MNDTTTQGQVDETDRNQAIQIIKAALQARSGKTWSVKGGKGTSWGWITITAPPARRDRGSLTDADRAELSSLLGTDVHHQGESIPASGAYRTEFCARARGDEPTTFGTPYWD